MDEEDFHVTLRRLRGYAREADKQPTVLSQVGLQAIIRKWREVIPIGLL